ncbi:hypothetical protein ACRRTK_010802 [Alexandromys fortis]
MCPSGAPPLAKQDRDPGHIHKEKQPACRRHPSDAEDRFPFLAFGLRPLQKPFLFFSLSATSGISR